MFNPLALLIVLRLDLAVPETIAPARANVRCLYHTRRACQACLAMTSSGRTRVSRPSWRTRLRPTGYPLRTVIRLPGSQWRTRPRPTASLPFPPATTVSRRGSSLPFILSAVRRSASGLVSAFIHCLHGLGCERRCRGGRRDGGNDGGGSPSFLRSSLRRRSIIRRFIPWASARRPGAVSSQGIVSSSWRRSLPVASVI